MWGEVLVLAILIVAALTLGALYLTTSAEKQQLQSSLADLRSKCDGLNSTYKSLLSERDLLEKRLEEAGESLQKIKSSYYELESNYTRLMAEYTKLRGEFNRLNEEYRRLNESLIRLQNNYVGLKEALSVLQVNYTRLKEAYEILQRNYTSLQGKYVSLESAYVEAVKTVHAFEYLNETGGVEPEEWLFVNDYVRGLLSLSEVGEVLGGKIMWSLEREGITLTRTNETEVSKYVVYPITKFANVSIAVRPVDYVIFRAVTLYGAVTLVEPGDYVFIGFTKSEEELKELPKRAFSWRDCSRLSQGLYLVYQVWGRNAMFVCTYGEFAGYIPLPKFIKDALVRKEPILITVSLTDGSLKVRMLTLDGGFAFTLAKRFDASGARYIAWGVGVGWASTEWIVLPIIDGRAIKVSSSS